MTAGSQALFLKKKKNLWETSDRAERGKRFTAQRGTDPGQLGG